MGHLQENLGKVFIIVYLSLLFQLNLPPFLYSPFLWGEAALEHYKLRRGIFWRPPDVSDILKLLDTHTLLKSSSRFPTDIQLEVSDQQNPCM